MPSGLYVIGSRAELDGRLRWNLMTANLVVQVATDPKLVAAAVESASLTCRLVESGGCFSVNMVARDDRELVRRFVKPLPVVDVTCDQHGEVTALAGHPVTVAETGAPILDRAPAWLDCRVRERLPLGSHTLFVGTVVGFGGPTGEIPPLLRMEDTRMNYGG
jgi:flavin reductase (DIM6/NTAB) family NADH-FMN oxidoreductase RutF